MRTALAAFAIALTTSAALATYISLTGAGNGSGGSGPPGSCNSGTLQLVLCLATGSPS